MVSGALLVCSTMGDSRGSIGEVLHIIRHGRQVRGAQVAFIVVWKTGVGVAGSRGVGGFWVSHWVLVARASDGRDGSRGDVLGWNDVDHASSFTIASSWA